MPDRVMTIPFSELGQYSEIQLSKLDERVHTQIARLDDMISIAKQTFEQETDPLYQDYLSDRLFRLLADRDTLVDQVSDIVDVLEARNSERQ